MSDQSQIKKTLESGSTTCKHKMAGNRCALANDAKAFRSPARFNKQTGNCYDKEYRRMYGLWCQCCDK